MNHNSTPHEDDDILQAAKELGIDLGANIPTADYDLPKLDQELLDAAESLSIELNDATFEFDPAEKLRSITERLRSTLEAYLSLVDQVDPHTLESILDEQGLDEMDLMPLLMSLEAPSFFPED
jgi:hypothetical protein